MQFGDWYKSEVKRPPRLSAFEKIVEVSEQTPVEVPELMKNQESFQSKNDEYKLVKEVSGKTKRGGKHKFRKRVDKILSLEMNLNENIIQSVSEHPKPHSILDKCELN